MYKKLLFIFVLLITFQASADDNNGWSELILSSSIGGCTLAQVNSTRRDYIARGEEKGNPKAAEEFPMIEDIVTDEFNKSCQCIHQNISLKWTYSEYVQNMQTILASPFFRELITPPKGKCAPNMGAIKSRILERKSKMNQPAT